MKKLAALGLILLLVLPFCLGSSNGSKDIEDDYDVVITYAECLYANGVVQNIYSISFKEGIASTKTEDGSYVIKDSIKKEVETLKNIVKPYSHLPFEVKLAENGDIAILETYENGYTERNIKYDMTGYDYNAGDGKTEYGFLFTTYIDEDTTVFAEENKDLAIVKILINPLISIAEKYATNKYSILKVYVRGTKYLNSYTTNADKEELDEAGSVKYYYFYVEPNNLGRTYRIENRSVNLPVWYTLAIATGGIVAIATIIAIKTAKKKEIIYG